MKLTFAATKYRRLEQTKQSDRRWIYFGLLAIIYVAWISYMSLANKWTLFLEYWPASVTMSLGSFVAGATAEGGAAVAFPVFTKVLHIPSSDARTFGLMIQSFGMTMASVMIYVQRVKILPRVVGWVSLGGIVGQLVGTFLVVIPEPYPKLLFTFVATAFGVVMIISRWFLKWEPREDLAKWGISMQAIFFLVGIVGGTFAAQTGSGIDMLTFIVLTLAFGMNEKISTPTTVVIMGLNSVVGFFLHGVVLQDVGIMWNYWLVAVPVVVIGAPLGAYVAYRVSRDSIIIFLLTLITIELVTTLWLVPFTSLAEIVFTVTAVFVCTLFFWLMLAYRNKYVPVEQAQLVD
jgi:uncharacterized membrane protein YfcA